MVTALVLIAHFAASFAMTGIMWFVQIAYYPNLACIGPAEFVRYQHEHIRRVTAVAWTMLIVELATALILPLLAAPLLMRSLAAANLLLLLVVWYSTWFVQVPLHKVLEQGYRAEVHRRLVQTNWVRTICYSIRGALLLGLMAAMHGAGSTLSLGL
jgi:hypothetical protein